MTIGRWVGLAAAFALAVTPVAHARADAKAARGQASVKSASRAKADKKAARHGKRAPQKRVKMVASKPPPPPPLDGATYDYVYDAADVGRPERAWEGRAFVHRKAAEQADRALPLLVFIHGMNVEKIPYRWIGGGQEGDVRRILSALIEGGTVPPMLLAAPTSTAPAAVGVAATSWPGFDLDAFLDRTEARLAGKAKIDRSRIIVAGHSAAGCNVKGGIATALKARTPILAGLVIDTCMGTDLAKDLAQDLARAPKTLNLVVTWQSMSWESRPFKDFRAVFEREIKNAPPAEGMLRELAYEQPKKPMPHDAMVELTFAKWLPRLLSPPRPGGG